MLLRAFALDERRLHTFRYDVPEPHIACVAHDEGMFLTGCAGSKSVEARRRCVKDRVVLHFDIDATRKENLVNGLDEIGLTLRHAEAKQVRMALVMTPQMLAPRASGRMIASGVTLETSFCATLAVLGTQLTPAMPMKYRSTRSQCISRPRATMSLPTTEMLFSDWHATTQALQPVHALRSMTIPHLCRPV